MVKSKKRAFNPIKEVFRLFLIAAMITFILINLIAAIFLISPFYNVVVKRAYQSYYTACFIPVEQTIGNGTNVAPNIGGYYDPNNNEIFVNGDLPQYYQEIVLKHELCHRNQNEQDRVSTCLNPIGKMLNEMECYLKQYE